MFDWEGEGGEDGVDQGEQRDEDQRQPEEEIFTAGQQQLPAPPSHRVLDAGELQQLFDSRPPVRVPGHHQLDDSPQLGLELHGEAGVGAPGPQVVPQLAAVGKIHVSGELQQCHAETEDVAGLGECAGQNLRC